MHLRSILPILGLLFLGFCVQAMAAATPGSGSVWRIIDYRIPKAATLTPEQAQAWLGKTARISQTSISFEGRTCRVTPVIQKIRAGVLLAAYNTTPAELGIPNQGDAPADVVDTGCDIPGFETMLSLPDGRFVLIYKGAFFFLEKNPPPSVDKGSQQDFGVPEAGLKAALPQGVRMYAPRQTPAGNGSGLGLWYEALPMSRLKDNAPFPFRFKDALLLRAALAAQAKEAQGQAGIASLLQQIAPQAVTGKGQPVALNDNALGLSFYSLHIQDTDCPLFRASALFFRNGWLTQIGLEAPPGTVIRENPGYFTTAPPASACAGGQVWGREPDMERAFYSAMGKGTLPGVAGQWRKTFQELLQSVTLRPPRGGGFMAADHTPCSEVTPVAGTLLPSHSFGIKIPGLGSACLLAIDTGEGDVLRITTTGGLNILLDPAATVAFGAPIDDTLQNLRIQAIGVDDLDADSLPDIIAILQGSTQSGAPLQANRIFFSRAPAYDAANALPTWQSDPAYDAAIAELPTVADVKTRVTALRAALDAKIGDTVRLQGIIGNTTADYATVLPLAASDANGGAFAAEEFRLLLAKGRILAADGTQLPLPATGAALDITARVLEAEDLFGPMRLTIAPIPASLPASPTAAPAAATPPEAGAPAPPPVQGPSAQ